MLLTGKVSTVNQWKLYQSEFKLNAEKDDNYNNYIIYVPSEGKHKSKHKKDSSLNLTEWSQTSKTQENCSCSVTFKVE